MVEELCSAYLKKDGSPCKSRVYGDNVFCGRHGGSGKKKKNTMISGDIGIENVMKMMFSMAVDGNHIIGPSLKLKDGVCVICFDKAKVPSTTTCCKQYYCKECIMDWCNSSLSCPCCRQKINRIVSNY